MGVCALAAIMHWDGGPGRSSHTAFVMCPFRFPSAGLIGFLFMLRALVAANFNTIYIYTAEVSFGVSDPKDAWAPSDPLGQSRLPRSPQQP